MNTSLQGVIVQDKVTFLKPENVQTEHKQDVQEWYHEGEEEGDEK